MKKLKKTERLDPPKSTTGDNAYLLGKAILSLIPGATELFERFITPPLQKRTEKWMEDVAETLRNLEKNQGIKLEILQDNDRFITIVMQATTVAVRNHQREKLIALKNAIINSALSYDFGEDLELIFIRFIEELTPSHFYLLKYFVDNEIKLSSAKSYPELYQLFSAETTNIVVQNEFKMLMGDLDTRGLIRISPNLGDFQDIYQASMLLLAGTRDDLPRLIITDVAKKFLSFISYSPSTQ